MHPYEVSAGKGKEYIAYDKKQDKIQQEWDQKDIKGRRKNEDSHDQEQLRGDTSIGPNELSDAEEPIQD